MGINATYNEAYAYVTANVVPMKQNSSYQTGHLLHCPNVAVHSDHSDGIEKQRKGTDSEPENPCTNTTATERLQITVQSMGDSWTTCSTPSMQKLNQSINRIE